MADIDEPEESEEEVSSEEEFGLEDNSSEVIEELAEGLEGEDIADLYTGVQSLI